MSDLLQSILSEYSTRTTPKTNKVTPEENLKKYFAPVLPKDKKTVVKKVRLIPPRAGQSAFPIAYFHELTVDGKKVKIYDYKNDGLLSPLNEVSDAYFASSETHKQEIGKNYRGKKFYVIKLIDRENEGDGIKFYRFKDKFKKDGVYDKIMALLQNEYDIYDPEKGYDLLITVNELTSPNGQKYSDVVSIMPARTSSPLSTNPELAEEWLSDESTWRNVYSKKSVEYMEILSKGKTPVYSSESKKYIAKEDKDEIGDETIGKPVNASDFLATTIQSDNQTDEVVAEGDDLPF